MAKRLTAGLAAQVPQRDVNASKREARGHRLIASAAADEDVARDRLAVPRIAADDEGTGALEDGDDARRARGGGAFIPSRPARRRWTA